MPANRRYRHFDTLMVGFVVVLVCSNLIGPAKIAVVALPLSGPFVLGRPPSSFPFPTCSATS